MNSQKKSIELFDDSKLGICHILPTFAVRRIYYEGNYERMTNVCFTVPAYCIIHKTVMREANIRLYGTTIHSGVRIKKEQSQYRDLIHKNCKNHSFNIEMDARIF
ncbi:hypothetical protein BH23THE1_BH23THE1_16940 [soil metagenome]